MNDYRFGNYLTELRQRSGMTQQLLAYKLGVTDKAVSKWENGRSRPSILLIQKLAHIYNVSMEEILSMKDTEKPDITKIVLTGGPCAGKTTAMSWIQKEFGDKRGYAVLFVPETATELIRGGVSFSTCGTNLDFQKCLARLQKTKESVFEEAAGTMNKEKVLIVCDRGLLDNKAYMSRSEFDAVMRSLGTSEVEARDNYDGVFHLVTAAKGALPAYIKNKENNPARYETAKEAAERDDSLIASWTGHPHLRVIDNSTEFDEKMRRLNAEISALLGEPEPMETERKYLIRYPDLAALEAKPNCEKVEIIQTYLRSSDDAEIRVRQRGKNGDFVFYRTEKRRISDMSRAETERRITQKEYIASLAEADPDRHPIYKTRYCLTENSCYYEIDIYQCWNKQAILEIELRSEDDEVVIPEGLKVIKEVTQDKAYSNYEMAARMPEE